MRSPMDFLRGRMNGMPVREITRRTVPCYKHVDEEAGEELAVCLLIDSRHLYRYPYEKAGIARSLAIKAQYLRGEMEDLRLREYQPGHCRYVNRAESAAAGS